MKTTLTPNRRALVALLPTALLFAGPAFAQDTPTVTPPPVATAAPPPAAPVQTVAPPRIVSTVPQAAPAPVAADPAAVAEVRRPAPRTVRRAPQPVARVRTVPPVAAVPAPVEAPAPVTVAAPEPAAAPPVSPNPAPQIDFPVDTASTTSNGAPLWPLILGGVLLIVALGAFLLLRRRRVDEDEYYEEAYVEPPVHQAVDEFAAAPILPPREPMFLRPEPAAAVAPALVIRAADDAHAAQVASEDVALAPADAGDVAALTTADAPVSDRPWLEFAMRPIRAGTNVDEALVEIELTIGNSGSMAAKDVRVSTFLFAAEPGQSADMERLLVDHRGDSSMPPVTIAAGEGTRVDATLAVPRADLGVGHGDSFSPVVVADARYTLPDGSEGRTSASFRIGVTDLDGAAMAPFPIDTRAMRDDIEAELYGVPEHA